MIDDVVTRINYEAAIELCDRLSDELAKANRDSVVVTPNMKKVAEKLLEAQRIKRGLRREMAAEIAG